MKKRSYKKGRKSREKDNYQTYLRMRSEWEEKGYTLDNFLSRKEFESAYSEAKRAGLKNITRELAKSDRAFTLQEARNLVKTYNEITGQNLSTREFLKLDLGGKTVEYYHPTAKENRTRQQTSREAIYTLFMEHGYEQDFNY